MTPVQPRRAVRWTVRALFAVPAAAVALLVGWVVWLSAGTVVWIAGLVAVALTLAAAWSKIREQ